VSITAEEIEREKKTLPFGWGRFGKALDRLGEISAANESLLASCVALNPEYHYQPRFVPGTALGAGHALHELTKSTNVVLACTNERLIMISTGGGGGPREHVSILYEGMEIISRDKKEFVLGLPDGQIRIRGAAKQQVPRFLDALAAHARPAESSPE
jgi:Bacterial PH domain